MAQELHDHLFRLLLWAGLSIVVGLALRRRPFGIMTLAWGLIDGAIALLSGRGEVPPVGRLVPFVAFNEGLNAGYVGVGIAMALLAGNRKIVKEFGWAVAAQGAALLVLDGVLWSRLYAAGV